MLLLPVEAWILLSGTFAHNKWSDIAGYIRFLKGHPYHNKGKFFAHFASFSYTCTKGPPRPSAQQMARLQRFLQSMIIMRSVSMLKLPTCRQTIQSVYLPEHQADIVFILTERYQKASQMASSEPDQDSERGAAAVGATLMAYLY